MTHPSRRQFLKRSLAATAALAVPARLSVAAPNDAVRVAFVGCGQRAAEHAPVVAAVPGVTIAGLCDPDGMRREMGKRLYPQAKAVADMRRLFDDPGIDAVFITTCDHWHALAAIWAMEAGKDVYIEKPLAHNFWEGQQIVAAAKKYGRICQVGTQQRSDPMQAEIRRFLHEKKALGKIETVRAHRYRVRDAIGKRDAPLAIPEIIDYNLWLGPAQDVPIWRKSIHYDWHWVWNTGTGEIGNLLDLISKRPETTVFWGSRSVKEQPLSSRAGRRAECRLLGSHGLSQAVGGRRRPAGLERRRRDAQPPVRLVRHGHDPGDPRPLPSDRRPGERPPRGVDLIPKRPEATVFWGS